MRSNKRLYQIPTIVLVILSLFVSTVRAEEPDLLQIKISFAELWPDISIDCVNRTDLDGLFEVVTEQGVAYYMPKSNQTIIGKMFDKDGQDLSTQAIDKVSKERFAILAHEKDKAIRVGNGPIEVIEATDPDCPHCREMERFWKKRTDVTRYVFLAVDASNSNSVQKGKFILAAADQAQTLADALTGKFDFDENPNLSHEDHGLLALHQQLVEKTRILGTPTYTVNGIFVDGADIDKIEGILSDAKSNNEPGELD